ncbi:MAG: copper-binding protein [Reyranella sp.]|nr:copper-binding protein [Reyranella sp.]MBL6650042.1 copper-binding protein [Reyranella sp.]
MAPVLAASPVDHGQIDHSKMDHAQAPAPQVAQAAHVQGTGTVKSIDAAGHKVNLAHNPIPAIGWPAMTMDFAVAPSVDLKALKLGARVTFTMQRGGDGMYVIQSIAPAGGQ